MPEQGMTPTGNWKLAMRLLERSAPIIEQSALVGLEAAGEFYVAETKKGIISQAPGGMAFEPLSPVTIAKKGSSKALIDHGDLLRSITKKELDRGRTMFIGLLRTTMHPGTGEPVDNLGRVHEQGWPDRNIPPRPFLMPIAYSRTLKAQARKVAMGAALKRARKLARRP